MSNKASHKVKNLWRTTGRGLSLKQFARELSTGDSEDAQLGMDWFSNKSETNQKLQQAERLKKKSPMLEQMRQAKKSSKA